MSRAFSCILYKRGVGIRRTKHAVFDIKYHLVWVPKYRKRILIAEVVQYTKEVLQRVAEEYGFWVDTMEVMEDHVRIFLEAPPKYSPAEVMQMLKNVWAREVFKKFQRLRGEFWAGELWNDGYFVRSVGDKVTADISRRYIEYQTQEHNSPQLPLFD